MNIKEILKKKIVGKADATYKKGLYDKCPSFDEWIRDKEKSLERFDMTVDIEGHGNENSNALSYSAQYGATSVRIIPFKTVNNSFKFQYYIEDILVFVDGELTDKAIPLLVKRFNEKPDISIIYGDEDIAKIDETESTKYGKSKYGTRKDPYFKPEWSPNTFLDHFYFCNMVALRRSSFRDVETEHGNDGAEIIYGTLLKFIFRNEFTLRKAVEHLDEILVHANNYSNNALKAKNVESVIENHIGLDKDKIKISVVIPSKNNPHLLEPCLKSLDCFKGEGVELQIIVVDNGSDDVNKEKVQKLLANYDSVYKYMPMEFNFAAQCNAGVAVAKHPYVLLLNDDIIFTQENTLISLYEQAKLRFCGAVGIKLLYPDSFLIQHAGVVSSRIGPVHKLQFCDDRKTYYHGYNRSVINVSSVTAACLMVRKDVYEKVNGMNENLKVAFNDIDFCYRLLEAGYVNVSCNNVSAIHGESLTRGKDTDAASIVRLNKEKDRLFEEHPAFKGFDPYYSKYLLSDCLDSRIVPANEYEYERASEFIESTKKESIENAREDRCVQLSLEYCGEKKNFSFREEDGDYFYFQGFSYVSGSNNACYKKYLFFQSEKTLSFVPYEGCIRKDVSLCCEGETNVEKSGFSVTIPKGIIEKGEYRVGVLMVNKFAREKLYTFSNRFLVVK